MIQHDWRDRLIAAGLGVAATAGIGWFSLVRDQPVKLENHEVRIGTLEKQLAELPGKVAEAVVEQLKGAR